MITAAAAVSASWYRYFLLERKASCSGPALASGARPVTGLSPSPENARPSLAASSPSVITMVLLLLFLAR
jgi:hypothetical protein